MERMLNIGEVGVGNWGLNIENFIGVSFSLIRR
jgi:hypothetical protein